MTKIKKIQTKKNLKQAVNNFRKPGRSKPHADSAPARGIWLYGKHPVMSALQKKRREVFQILATKNSAAELEKFLQENKIFSAIDKIKIVEASQIQAVVGENQTHQGLALNCSLLPMKSQNNLFDEIEKLNKVQEKLPVLLILDQLKDPHNVGAIIRSACAFGVKKIIFPDHNFCKETAAMNKTSSGMIENVDLYLVGNLNNLMAKLKECGYWCIGLAGEGAQNISKIKEYKNIALIIGSEGEGIRDLVKKNCDLLVKIPMDKDVESLNAAAATSIALYEISREVL